MKSVIFTFFLSLFIATPFLFSQQQMQEPKMVTDEIIVRMRKGETPYNLERNLPSVYEVKVDQVLSKHSDIWLLKFNPKNVNLLDAVSAIEKENTVLVAQPNREVTLRQAPNDPLYGNQWQHQKIDSEAAWDITTGGTTPSGTDIVVALIESADLINHSDLKDNHWKNTAEIPGNGIDDDGNGYVDDYNGWNVSTGNDNIGTGSHGTSCAGMIGAKGDNNLGVTGINWNVKIMNIAGHNNPFTEANIVQAYNYALEARLLWNQTNGAQGAFVVATSASWGVDNANPNNYPIWCGFYDDLGQAGILNAGATTNNNSNVDQVGDVPSACPSNYMVSVTATNQSDIIDFAGYGATTVDVAAPGSSIYTTASNNGYTTTSGTSFATPLTAGLIGLMYSVPCPNLEVMAKNDPQGTANIVRQALFDGVDQTAYLQTRTVTGGRINAKNALDELMNQVCSSCLIPSRITTDVVGENSAEIYFSGNGNSTDYNIYIREIGSTTWTNYTVSDTNYIFTNLSECTEYEYYVASVCDDEESDPSSISTFLTMGCGNCIDLDFCDTKANNPSVKFTVNSPANIQGDYTFMPTSNFGGNVSNGYVYGELVLVDDGTNNSNEGCNSLINSNDINGNIAIVRRGTCNFTVKVKNAQNAGATAVIVVNNTSGAPTEMGGTDNTVTIPAVMISQSAGNSIINSINNGNHPMALLGQQNEWISSFSINGNTVTSNANTGYSMNYNALSFYADSTYSFQMIPGFDGQPLPEFFRIWMDFSQDGSFDNNELIYDQGTASIGSISDYFTIPQNAQLGNTRMRIQLAYQPTNNAPLPSVCGDFNSGEIVDFCVEIMKVIEEPDNGDEEDDDTIDDDTSAISENELGQQIPIYPNPTNGKLTIDNRKGEISEIKIYSTEGQLVRSISPQAELTHIKINKLANGIYYFHCFEKNGRLSDVKKISLIAGE